MCKNQNPSIVWRPNKVKEIFYVGVVGSGAYERQDIVYRILPKFVSKNMIIVSGRSPRNKGDNVDVWAEQWGKIHCIRDPLIYPADSFTKGVFFARNKKIGIKSDLLLMFIPKGKFQSGAWNTLKWFLLRNQGNPAKKFYIFDELGELWTSYPPWVNKYIQKYPTITKLDRYTANPIKSEIKYETK
jgi:hypothetical protein